MKSTRQSRINQRKKGYIASRLLEGDTKVIKRLLEYSWIHDLDHGTNFYPILGELFMKVPKLTYAQIMNLYGISDIKDLKAFINRINALAEKLDESMDA